MSAAGTTYCLNEPLLCRLIRDAGFVPAQRDNVYDLMRIHTCPESPDLQISDWSTQRATKLVVQTDASDDPPVDLTIGASEQAAELDQ